MKRAFSKEEICVHNYAQRLCISIVQLVQTGSYIKVLCLAALDELLKDNYDCF